MESLRILIADDDDSVSSCLSMMLQNIGHAVIGLAACGKEAVDQARLLDPDFVIMDIRMDDLDGLDASKLILAHKPLPILVLTAFTEKQLIEKAVSIGVSGYLVKPFFYNELQPAILLAWSQFHQRNALKAEIGGLQETIRGRRLIEQAKGLLMDMRRLSESEAYDKIRGMSRNRNIPMARIAEAIIMTAETSNTPKLNRPVADGKRMERL